MASSEDTPLNGHWSPVRPSNTFCFYPTPTLPAPSICVGCYHHVIKCMNATGQQYVFHCFLLASLRPGINHCCIMGTKLALILDHLPYTLSQYTNDSNTSIIHTSMATMHSYCSSPLNFLPSLCSPSFFSSLNSLHLARSTMLN